MAFTPIDPTKAEVRITGTAPNQELDFYIPRGAKGEPGGFTIPTALATVNLNTIVTSGLYRQDSAVTPSLALNYPVVAAGILTVYERLRDAVYQSVVQEYQPVNSVNGVPAIYRRYYFGNATWTAWKAYTSTRVDQTAGRAIYAWDDVNGREQLIYGDTGWRDVSANLINGWTGLVKIRRVGATVTINYGSLTESTATAKEIYPLPTGFANGEWIRWMTRTATLGIQDMMLTNTNLSLYGAPGATASNISNGTYSSVIYTTTAPWPTVLPGIAQGTIPNL